jgi:CRISPR/Cas system-associated endonuclease Cas1
MPCLYVTEQGAVLRKSGDRVIVQKEDAVLGDGPADVGVLLRHEARKRFFAALEKELTTPNALAGEELSFRDLFRRQSERLARSLVDRVPYESFRWPAS